ncbi:amino acid ABC transporter substrate-binding protein, PAAT family [Jatrophihabitans endophyticus]|uniref:Amino acid ABC transporter substrate-binding protein, PAAT family n=1 Tax=Jatrophihabitans endophyticus TaxID=1206085 RepID=A0A1M5EMT3_9ACTN|nr:ABC transporter substrate-binding protein [Jatrophihabitans endophyticus]SHF80420.1 amino acid ABC transporter substrate-binding protein, PAAT family [Jatrophihabitans endophyticus]
MRPRLPLTVLTAVAAIGLLAGCSAESDGGSGGPSASGSGGASGSASGSACRPAQLRTYAQGKLTVATDSPAYAPWFSDNKPTNGKGYESSVVYAVAKRLGFAAADVSWTKATFDSVIAPTPKRWDFDANQFSITAQRAKAVDFSSPYYDVTQSVVTLKSSKFAKATTIAALKGAKLGAERNTTSYDAITDQIKPTRSPAPYPSNDLAVQALKNGTIDGLVVDLPTGFYVTSAQLDDAKIVGQLPAVGKTEQFGLVLAKGSALTRCVSSAVDALRTDGTLTRLQQKWLAGAGAPKLS